MIEVRRALTTESETFLELVDALADYEKLEPPTEAAKKRLVRDGFSEPRRFTPNFAILDGEVVGYAMTYFTYSSFLARPTLYLEDLFVKPSARSKGVGRAIFRFLAQEALDADCGRMDWVVLDWNRLAIDFYERLGGQRLAEWHTYRLDSEALEKMAAAE